MYNFIIYFGVILITGGVAYGDHSYLKIQKILATWDEASLQCEQQGGILASPINSEVLKAMKSLMSDNRMYDIGTRAGYSPGTYVSREGVPLVNMTAVMDNMVQELDPEHGDCLAMDQQHIVLTPCWTRLPYMCSKKKTPKMGCGYNDDGYKYNSTTRKCYKVHKDRYYTWDEGAVICAGETGRLAVVENENDKQAVLSLYKFPNLQWIFIGLRDVTGSGNWWTVDGRAVKLDVWLNGNIPHDNKNVCGAMHTSKKIENIDCFNTRHFICERDPTVI